MSVRASSRDHSERREVVSRRRKRTGWFYLDQCPRQGGPDDGPGDPLHRDRGFSRPPMEQTEVSAKLIALTQRIAEELGTPRREITMGGAADGNFTGTIGVPALDGMGPDGGLSHSEREFLELPSNWERMAILIWVIDHLSEKGLS